MESEEQIDTTNEQEVDQGLVEERSEDNDRSEDIDQAQEMTEISQKEKERASLQRRELLIKKTIGTSIYIYFGAFVVFHAATALTFMLTSMNPWLGLFLWLLITVLGAFCVVALSVWRGHLHTFWD